MKGRLREIQQEHRILLDRINGLQLQLNEVMDTVCNDSSSEDPSRVIWWIYGLVRSWVYGAFVCLYPHFTDWDTE